METHPKTQQKLTGRKYTQGLLFWVKHTLKPMKMYLLAIFIAEKKYSYWKRMGFLSDRQLARGFSDEKIPRVRVTLNPSTPTKPRKHTNHKHNLTPQLVFFVFSMVSLFPSTFVFWGKNFPFEVFLLQTKATYHGVCQLLPKSNLLFQVLPRASVLRNS